MEKSDALERKIFRRYKAGYEVWDEKTVCPGFSAEVIDGGDDPAAAAELADQITTQAGVAELIWMRRAYTPAGDYIGTQRWGHRLCVTRGIAPELADPDHKVCSIGFCEREQKWYGWSHRAIYGFGVGDVVKEGDCTATSGWTDDYLAQHPEDDLSLPVGFEAKTLEDARRMAIAFADSVG